MKTITQILFSIGILFSGFSVICLGNNPVLAVVFLIITFVLSAILLILMGINFKIKKNNYIPIRINNVNGSFNWYNNYLFNKIKNFIQKFYK